MVGVALASVGEDTMPATVTHAGLSDPGLTHQGNEDRWLALPERGLYLVSDGMADALAPQMAVDLLPDLLLPRLAGVGDLADPGAAEGVRTALAELSDRIREEGRRRPEAGGPAATVVRLTPASFASARMGADRHNIAANSANAGAAWRGCQGRTVIGLISLRWS